VGDRLSTDIMMANMMGSYGVWVRDGVTGRGFVSILRTLLATLLKKLYSIPPYLKRT
jgi:phosphatidylglycerophosphatase GEP4